MLVFSISSLKSLKIRPLSISYSYSTKEKTAFHERLNWFSYTYSVECGTSQRKIGIRSQTYACLLYFITEVTQNLAFKYFIFL